jgi:hypothetical protein
VAAVTGDVGIHTHAHTCVCACVHVHVCVHVCVTAVTGDVSRPGETGGSLAAAENKLAKRCTRVRVRVCASARVRVLVHVF